MNSIPLAFKFTNNIIIAKLIHLLVIICCIKKKLTFRESFYYFWVRVKIAYIIIPSVVTLNHDLYNPDLQKQKGRNRKCRMGGPMSLLERKNLQTYFVVHIFILIY